MRSFKGARGGPVALAALAERRPKFVFDLGGGRLRAPLRAALRARSARTGRGLRRAPPASPRSGHEARDRIEPGGGDRHSGFRHLPLEPLEQSAGAFPELEQPVPLPHGAVVAAKRAPHLGSTASTSRSRNRRRSDAGPVNNPSIAGRSQTRLTCSASAPALLSLPAMRTVRALPSSLMPEAMPSNTMVARQRQHHHVLLPAHSTGADRMVIRLDRAPAMRGEIGIRWSREKAPGRSSPAPGSSPAPLGRTAGPRSSGADRPDGRRTAGQRAGQRWGQRRRGARSRGLSAVGGRDRASRRASGKGLSRRDRDRRSERSRAGSWAARLRQDR